MPVSTNYIDDLHYCINAIKPVDKFHYITITLERLGLCLKQFELLRGINMAGGNPRANLGSH
jgi:hypothetical protein